MPKSHYYTTKLIKMGIWSLPPGDCETWHGQHTSDYFKKHFGIPKESLLIYEGSKNFQHAYITQKYIRLLHSQIDKINKKDFRGLSKKLTAFYPLVKKAKQIVSQKYENVKTLSGDKLTKQFRTIRDRIQHIAIFDQFAWYAEEYWTPKLESILTKKLKLEKGSKLYNQALFTLTKPEEISTTLREKRAVIEQVLKIKTKKQTLQKAAEYLAKTFGWMPVFCYGEAWQADHYIAELQELQKKDLKDLTGEYLKLKNYTKIRNQEVAGLVKKYSISKKDLQVFIEFGLAIDTRNEAEYFVSFGGFYLVPLFKEIARRLYLSVTQVRLLTEKEMLDCLADKENPEKILASRPHWFGWGFSPNFKTRINFSEKESKQLFTHIEKYVQSVQGGDQKQGTCASPGVARGKIRIIPSPNQNGRVKDGDILVTYSTTTDYLPAMKRAAAIITEVGGLTCHAAVVSREFGIPCVVALANAMKNFTDGEMVEVNANAGTVTPIR